jgi:hypothetical protein
LKKPDNRAAVQKQFKERRDFGKYGDSDMVTVGVRLSPADRDRLEAYFSKRDLKLSQGLRMAIKEWMADKRV